MAEAGQRGLPVTWVAVGVGGEAAGAVGLGEFDIAERRDRSPWVLGMVVRSAVEPGQNSVSSVAAAALMDASGT